MKKFLVSLLLVLPLCGFAQKGSQGISVNLGFETCIEALDFGYYEDACKLFPISVKYHNHLTDRIRIAPYIEYVAADEYGCFHHVDNFASSKVSLHKLSSFPRPSQRGLNVILPSSSSEISIRDIPI